MPTKTLERKNISKDVMQRVLAPTCEVRKIDAENRIATFVVSSESIDSYGTIIKQAGIDYSRFDRNPVIPFVHDTDDLPVGRAVARRTVGSETEMDIQFATVDMNPLAEQCWLSVQGGFLRATSISFFPIEWHWERNADGTGEVLIYDKVMLYEVSIVPVPSNADALAKSVSRSLRSKDSEKRAQAEAMVEFLTRAAAINVENVDEEDAEDEDGEQDQEDRDILRAYRKLVPSLRRRLNVETKEEELEQVAAIRAALERDAEPEKPKEEEPKPDTSEKTEPAPTEPKPEDKVEPEEKPSEEPDEEPEDLDEADQEAIAQAAAEKLSA